MRTLLLVAVLSCLLAGCVARADYSGLQSRLDEFVAGKDAKIGVAVIIDGRDTVEVNGRDAFPMFSVYKLPIAMAVAEYCRVRGLDFSDSCRVLSEDLHQDTYSPMLSEYCARDTLVSIMKLLEYSMQLSDNNASDILLKCVGGACIVDEYVARLGISGMNIAGCEYEMHRDLRLCHENYSTPIAAAKLVDVFDSEFGDSLSMQIKELMENCSTGTGRLVRPLVFGGAVVGHKTGTGDVTSAGRIMAVNDVGYVHLPNGHRYSIAVFIADSGYDMPHTENLIAGISEIVAETLW